MNEGGVYILQLAAVFWSHFAILLLKTVVRSVASMYVVTFHILLIQLLLSLIFHLQMIWFLMDYIPPKLVLKVSFYSFKFERSLCVRCQKLYLLQLTLGGLRKISACLYSGHWFVHWYKRLQILPSRNLVWSTAVEYWYSFEVFYPVRLCSTGNNLHYYSSTVYFNPLLSGWYSLPYKLNQVEVGSE